MSWTDERIQELSRLWQEGLSASEIGKQLGVSKNAVVGKAHRLKLPARPSPIKHTAEAKSDTANKKAVASKGNGAGKRESPAKATPARVNGTAETAGTSAAAAGSESGDAAAPASRASTATDSTTDSTTDRAVRHAANGSNGSGGGAGTTAAAPGAGSRPRRRTAAVTRGQGPSQRASVEARGGGGGGCLWPIGDPNDPAFHFCGADPLPGKPYCAEHAARAYITRSRSDREERDEEAA